MTVFVKLFLVTAPVWAVLWRSGLFVGRGELSLVTGLSAVIGVGLAGLSMWFGLALIDTSFGILPEVLIWFFCLVTWLVFRPWLTTQSSRLRFVTTLSMERPALSWLDFGWIVLLALLIATRVYLLWTQVTLPRIFPWDAWLVWVYEARVWFEQGSYLEFSPPNHLLTAPKGVWVGATTVAYPKLIPALVLWLHADAATWLGTPVGLLWLWLALSISLMLFGLARRFGFSWVGGMVVVYLWLSLPMVNAHIALFGYADLLVAGLLTALAMILIVGSDRKDRLLWPLFVLIIVALVFTKVEGIYWAAIIGLVLSAASLWIHAKKMLMATIIFSAAFVLIAWVLDLDWLSWVTQGRLSIDLSSIGLGIHGILRHAYLYYDWHLMFYLLVTALFLLVRYPHTMAHHLGFSLFCVAGLMILLVVLPLSGAQAWLLQSTLFSRIALHISGPLVLFGAVIFHTLWLGKSHVPKTTVNQL